MKNRNNSAEIKSKMVSIERWTIDRLDRESNTARIERVPLNPEFKSEFTKLINAKKLPRFDNLSWWKTDKYKVKILSIRSLTRKLQLKDDEKLSENMVFWLIGDLSGKTPSRVIHATHMARELTKEIYKKLSDSRKEGKNE